MVSKTLPVTDLCTLFWHFRHHLSIHPRAPWRASVMKYLLHSRSPEHEPWVRACTSSPLCLGAPQATLFCSHPFHFWRPAWVPLHLWSLPFLPAEMSSSSIALYGNHFYSTSPSSSVFALPLTSSSPTCTHLACWVLSSSSLFSCAWCVLSA